MSTNELLRRKLGLALLASAVVTAGCGTDDTTEPEPEPNVASIVITAGASTVTINNTTGAQIGTFNLRTDGANTVTFRFLDASGQDEPVIVAQRSQFEVRPGSPLPSGVVFTGGSAGTGARFIVTINPTVTGTVVIPFQLWHIGEGHAELQRTVTASAGATVSIVQ